MTRRLLLLLALFLALYSNGKGRILIIDPCIDTLINVDKVYYTPKEFNNNPILKAEKEWEYNATGDPYAAPFSGGTWYDEEDNLFKMWYSAGGNKKHGLITCYAISTDGEVWTRPELDIVPGTNIVDTIEHDCVTVLLDKYETDRAKRFKMFNIRFDTPSAVSMILKYSSDGIHWGEPVAVSGDLLDRCSAFYDPFREHYVLSLKTKDNENRRARNYLANKDPELAVSLAHRLRDNRYDKFIRFWFSADDDDPHHPDFPEIKPAIYNHDAIPYENVLLGQFCVWQGPENSDCIRLKVQKRNEILLGFSYDGFNWNRECKKPFIPVGTIDSWNAGNIQSTMGSPIIVGDSLFFYYSGRYNSRPEHASNFATGLAKLRRDGFVSAKAKDTSGYIISKPIKVEKEYLFLNANLSENGEIKVEFLDCNGIPLSNFAFSDSKGINNLDSTKIQYSWNDRSLSSIKGKSIIVKISICNGELFSFWFSDSNEGESGGFTAGGGPNLSKFGRDI